MLKTKCEENRTVVVLVTDQINCERIILAGHNFAMKNNGELLVLNVNRPDRKQNPDAIEYLYKVSKDNNATMLVHYSDKPETCISEYIEENSPMAVITGIPSSRNSILNKLWLRFGNVDFYTADSSGILSEVLLADKMSGQL